MKILTKIVALAVALGAGYGYHQYRQGTATSPPVGKAPPRAVPVVLATAKTAPVTVRIDAIGRAEAVSTVTVRSRTDGQITAVHFAPGSRVVKGAPLLTLDARAIEAQTLQAEANLARDTALLDKARADLRRYEDLVGKGFVSAAQLDGYRASVGSLEATVRADLAALSLLKVQRAYTRIEAPMDGLAGAILAHPGASVKANDTALVVVNQLDPINVSFPVPERRLRELARGRQTGARLRVEARLPGMAEPVGTGELDFIDNAVDPATGTIQLKARFPNADARLTPGQFLEVSLTLRTIEDALVIPSEALQSGPEGNFVFVARPDQTVEVRTIVSEQADAQRLRVISGLTAGEQVVVDGQMRLTPGGRFEAREPARNR